MRYKLSSWLTLLSSLIMFVIAIGCSNEAKADGEEWISSPQWTVEQKCIVVFGPYVSPCGSCSNVTVCVGNDVRFTTDISDPDSWRVNGGDWYVSSNNAYPEYSWSGDNTFGPLPTTSTVAWVATEPGDYYLQCTVSDNPPANVGAPDPPVTVSWNVHVVSSGPPPVEDDLCEKGSTCGSCGDSGGSLPMPGIKSAQLTPTFKGGGPGTPGGGYGPGKGCRRCSYEMHRSCGNYYIRAWDSNGKCSVYGPYTSSFDLWINGNHFVGNIDSNSSTLTGTVTYPDGSTDSFDPSNDKYTGGDCILSPSMHKDALSNQTASYRADNGAIESVETPEGFTWNYEHTDPNFPTWITKAIAPDGTFSTVSYIASGYASGRIESVKEYDTAGNAVSTIDYSYKCWDPTTQQWVDDLQGRLRSATKSNKTITYDYPDNNTVVVREVHRITSGGAPVDTVYSETEYQYAQSYPTSEFNTTTITRKHLDGPGEDQTTTYQYYNIGPKQDQIRQVTDPFGKTTTYDYEDVVESAQRSYARLLRITDPAGCMTEYEYVPYPTGTGDMKWVPPVSAVVRKAANGAILSREEYTYYEDQNINPGAPLWQKTVKDVRGKYTYYERNLSNHPELIRKIKVSGAQKTDAEWSAAPAKKIFEYYDAVAQDGLPGQLKQETVPNIEGTTPEIKKYKYIQDGKYFHSPTQTIYRYSNGSGYVDKASYTYYDAEGRVIYTSDASGTSLTNGKKIWHTYDALGRSLRTIYAWSTPPTDDAHPETGVPSVYMENEYSCCTLLRSRDEMGNWTYYAYDDINRVTRTWTDVQALAWNGVLTDHGEVLNGKDCPYSLVKYDYDKLGNLYTATTYSDSSTARVTTYYHDKNNRVTRIEHPGSIGADEYGYDDLGNMWWKKDGNGDVTLYRYDNLNRLTNVYYKYTGIPTPGTYPASADVTYEYEGASSLTTCIRDSAGISRYAYNDNGQLEQYTPPTGLSAGYYVGYQYNDAGQKTRVRITNGTNIPYDVSYDYYANGWLKDVKNGIDIVASYTYDAVGNRRLQTNNINGTSTAYDYNESDSRYLLNSITHNKGTNALLTISYTTMPRDNAGNPMSMTDLIGSQDVGTWLYSYDANNRLVSAVPPNPVPDQPAGGPYTYDWVGNRLNPPADPNRMEYNAADQLKRWPGMNRYEYNNRGDLVRVTNDVTGAETASYTYTPAGLLDTASYNGRTLINAWDANSNRVRMNANGQEYQFVYDTTAGVPAIIQEDTPQGAIYYVREPNGALIARISGTDVIYYHFDALGSTRLLTDSSGAVTDRYAYDAYGAVIAHTGSTEQPYQYVGRFGYYTHYMEPEFGLLQLGVRFYDVKVGRFTQKDPANYDLNPYNYSLNRPLIVTDPSGKIPLIIIQCIANPLCRSAVGCIAGAIGNGAWSLFDDIIHGKQLDWSKAGRHAICGCIYGALLFNAVYEPGIVALDPIIKSITGTALTAWKKVCESFVDTKPNCN